MELKTLQGLYGLKWNPFSPTIPSEGLQPFPEFEGFCYRLEDLVLDGGFAACIGEPGLGKSVVMRLLNERLSQLSNVTVGELSRPHSSVNDFYRELADLFHVSFSTTNRYAGHLTLRKKWHSHIESTHLRPVLLIDEAQGLKPAIMDELKALSSEYFDSQMLLTIVFAGDTRLANLLESIDLKPIRSRLRHRLVLSPRSTEQLELFLKEALNKAGAPGLMKPDLISLLADRSMGNLRSLMTLANDCLIEAVRQELSVMDAQLFLDLASQTPVRAARKQNKK